MLQSSVVVLCSSALATLDLDWGTAAKTYVDQRPFLFFLWKFSWVCLSSNENIVGSAETRRVGVLASVSPLVGPLPSALLWALSGRNKARTRPAFLSRVI